MRAIASTASLSLRTETCGSAGNTSPDSYSEAPIEHLVKSEEDLPALRYVYTHTSWEPDYDYAYRRLEQIGDQGILLCYLPKSPFMHLVVWRQE